MIQELKDSLWKQLGAGMDMLENVIHLCPEPYDQTNQKFFYITFHTLVFLDYYATIPPSDFTPHLSFTTKPLDEVPKDNLGDVVPDKIYTKKELLEYLGVCRDKINQLIHNLTEEKIQERFVEELEENAMNYSVFEILLYNMRHLQHHVAQLNLLLKQTNQETSKWIFRTSII